MHDYAVEECKRWKVNYIVIIVYVLLAVIEPSISDYIEKCLNDCGKQLLIDVFQIIKLFWPGIGCGVLYKIYDLWLWKLLVRIHKIPNLNGKWKATINAPLKNHTPEIEMTIKQTWTKIQVTGVSEYGTRTVSDSASIINRNGVIYFSYSYWITPKNRVHYPGFNSLKYENGKLSGEYFSAKNVQEDLNKSCLERMHDEYTRKIILEKIKGCGSKGIIVMERQ